MHSSRMRTGHSLTVCWSLLPGGGVHASRGAMLPGGVCASGGVVSQHALRQTPPPVDRITDTSENITLATNSFRPVKILGSDL